ncbi:MAG: endonuclease domain-containing protein, partial [Candidatus Acidiferrales bacterium]
LLPSQIYTQKFTLPPSHRRMVKIADGSKTREEADQIAAQFLLAPNKFKEALKSRGVRTVLSRPDGKNLFLVHKKEQLQEQHGRCAICGATEPGNEKTGWQYDHSHDGSGEYRGVLCARCNGVLGWINDDEKILFEMILYLRKYQKTSLPNTEDSTLIPALL